MHSSLYSFQNNNEENCKNGAANYLVVAGGITIGSVLLALILRYLCESDDYAVFLGIPLSTIVVIVTTWGSVIVFSK